MHYSWALTTLTHHPRLEHRREPLRCKADSCTVAQFLIKEVGHLPCIAPVIELHRIRPRTIIDVDCTWVSRMKLSVERSALSKWARPDMAIGHVRPLAAPAQLALQSKKTLPQVPCPLLE